MDELKKLLSKISSSGDTSITLLTGITGFMLDAGLDFLTFLPPNEVGISSALFGLGIKKGYDALTEKRKEEAESVRKNFE